MKVYISGVHSGPNPSPGLGLARSIRVAYPDAQLVAVDYSVRSSGLHSSEFDEVWIQRPWDDLDLALYAMQIREVLACGALWLSGLDLEIIWLARTLETHPCLLIPSLNALEAVAKPEIPAHKHLPMKTPPFISVSRSDRDLHAFCREHGWRVWLKGPYYEAHRIWSWEQYNATRSILSNRWSTDDLFIQAHISGHEESVALAAYDGRLLGCVHMSKRDVTPEGKTWAAHITKVPSQILDPLQSVVEQFSWIGGAEIEFVRDCNDELWLLDWNPRFPAWIHGSTFAGHNLPALLVQACTGMQPTKTPPISQEFTRVVLEIPCRQGIPLPPLSEPSTEPSDVLSKHPSGMPKLAERLSSSRRRRTRQKPLVPNIILDDLQQLDISALNTPCRLRLQGTALTRFESSASLASELGNSGIKVQVAYSIKTDPDDWWLQTALACGMLVEAISQSEVERALSNGFSLDQIVLNGPGKWWPSRAYHLKDFIIVFSDSVEELNLYRDCQPDRIGIRLRLPYVDSRFGIPVDTYETFQVLTSVLKRFPKHCSVGLHFHLASSRLGVQKWRQLYDSFLGWARAIENSTGRMVSLLDVGGGWFPDDADQSLQSTLRSLVMRAQEDFLNLHEFILEPGKALTQPAMVLAVRVLEVRNQHPDHKEFVVDGAISDLPMATCFPHHILARSREGKWQPLAKGDDRILGRICMENDILAEQIHVPRNVRPGDILIICDAGAYDRSMSYAFGQG